MTPDALAGRLRLRPGERPPIVCERPMVGAALLGRLTEGRRAALVPDLLASVFTLGATAQRSTSRRAVQAALGVIVGTQDAAAIAWHTARDHLQRFALDLPTHASGNHAGVPPLAWLRDAPTTLAALAEWLPQRLFGMPVDRWLARWQRDGGAWWSEWCSQSDHPVAQWADAVRATACAFTLECRALDPFDDGDAGWRELGAKLDADPHFAEMPLWRGAPAETGPWTRAGHADAVRTVWDRLGARLADVARIASGVPLACGAVQLADRIGLAWTEMSRGLLVHWIELDADRERVARYRVLAPTEWNFHPDGSFGRRVAAAAASDAASLRLAAAALDPCVAFDIEVGASHHA